MTLLRVGHFRYTSRPMSKMDFRQLVSSRFKQIVAKNPAYSQRAFAKKIGLSPGTLSEVLSGRRTLSQTKMLSVLSRLDSDSESDLVEKVIERVSEEDQRISRVLLSREAEPLVANWLHYAILSVMEYDLRALSQKSLPARLGVTASEVADALKCLERAGLIRRNARKAYVSTGIGWRTQDGVIPVEWIRASHRGGLKLADQALDRIPPSARDFTSLTFPVAKEQLARFRAEIRKFQNKIMKLANQAGCQNTSMRLQVQLFPVDRWNEFEGEDKS